MHENYPILETSYYTPINDFNETWSKIADCIYGIKNHEQKHFF